MKIITTPNAAASQTEHPWRATARTLIQSVLGAALTIVGILILVPGALEELADALGEVGIVVPAALIALPPVIARIMAIPGIEKALRGVGLGAAPAETYLSDEEVYPSDGQMEDVWYIEPDHEEDEADADPEGPADDEEPALDESDGDDEGDADPEGLDDYETAAAAEVDLTPPPPGWKPEH